MYVTYSSHPHIYQPLYRTLFLITPLPFIIICLSFFLSFFFACCARYKTIEKEENDNNANFPSHNVEHTPTLQQCATVYVFVIVRALFLSLRWHSIRYKHLYIYYYFPVHCTWTWNGKWEKIKRKGTKRRREMGTQTGREREKLIVAFNYSIDEFASKHPSFSFLSSIVLRLLLKRNVIVYMRLNVCI